MTETTMGRPGDWPSVGDHPDLTEARAESVAGTASGRPVVRNASRPRLGTRP